MAVHSHLRKNYELLSEIVFRLKFLKNLQINSIPSTHPPILHPSTHPPIHPSTIFHRDVILTQIPKN